MAMQEHALDLVNIELRYQKGPFGMQIGGATADWIVLKLCAEVVPKKAKKLWALCPDLTDSNTLITKRAPTKIDLHNPEANPLQIFIKSVEGRHIYRWLHKEMRIQDLRHEIQLHLRILANSQHLIYSGHGLQDDHTL